MARRKNNTFASLLNKLGIEFKDMSLLDIALLHRSYSSEHLIAKDNERLEYLGDSILNACVSDIIFHMFPYKSEGDLTKIRARIVSRRALKKWGENIGLQEYIFLSDKMRQFMKYRETYVVSNAMEAIIGAIYLDGGYKKVYMFIKKEIINWNFTEIVDFKSRLQEFTVDRFGELPMYIIVSETGPSHSKKFKIAVSIIGKVYGEGTGLSKKMAQQSAAEKAYKKLSGKS